MRTDCVDDNFIDELNNNKSNSNDEKQEAKVSRDEVEKKGKEKNMLN